MENYEKKYKEALERAKKYYDRSKLINPANVLDIIFPELAESEDEKIRKVATNCVNWFGFDSIFFKEVAKEKVLSWLEKQKKQPAERVFTFDDVLALESAMVLARDDKELYGALKSIFERVHDTYHGEQKPAEWSEEDEENLDAAIEMAEHTLYEPLVPRDTLVSWLKSLKDRIKGVTILKVPTSKPKTENETIDLIGYE